MKMNEITFYHTSVIPIRRRTILVPRHTRDKWIDIVKLLEIFRPANMLAHDQAVFMTDYEYLESDWTLILQPIGIIEKHDMGWYEELRFDVDVKENKEIAENYWNGIPSENQN